jgi:hypothetical protein
VAYPTPRRPGARKKEDKSTVVTAAVVLGWLLFAFLAFRFSRTTSIRDDRIGRIRASQAELHKKHQEDVDAKKKAIHDRKMAAATTINEQNSAQAVVNSIVNKRLRPESEKLQTAVADLEQIVEKLTANVQTIADDLGTSGNELNRLKTRMRELGTEERKLKREYQQKYKEMKAVYRANPTLPISPNFTSPTTTRRSHPPPLSSRRNSNTRLMIPNSRLDTIKRYYATSRSRNTLATPWTGLRKSRKASRTRRTKSSSIRTIFFRS